MDCNPSTRHRRPVRLPGYDYAQAGAYFVTICTRNREYLFGEVVDGKMRPNMYGEAVSRYWDELPRHYSNLRLDGFVVMPDHLHGIIVLNEGEESVGAGLSGVGVAAEEGSRPARATPFVTATRRPLSEIVRALKAFSSRRINEMRGTPGIAVWQRGYYEHIIRDDESLNRAREYIANNPVKWELDQSRLNNAPEWGEGAKVIYSDETGGRNMKR